MKLSNKIWLILLVVVLITDLVLVLTLGGKSTLSYFLYTHKDFFFLPYAVMVVVGHGFNKLLFDKNYRYLIALGISLIVLGLSFIMPVMNVLIPIIFGYIIGWVFLGQKKL